MKYYSEVLDKMFDDLKTLKKEEESYAEKLEKAKAEKEQKQKEADEMRAQCQLKIDDATKVYNESLKAYNSYKEEAEKRLAELSKLVDKARIARYNAVNDYVEKFGYYTSKSVDDFSGWDEWISAVAELFKV